MAASTARAIAPASALDEVEARPGDDRADELEECRVVDRVGERIGLGRSCQVGMEDDVDLERLRLDLLVRQDAVARVEAHAAQGQPIGIVGHRRTIASATRRVRAMCATS